MVKRFLVAITALLAIAAIAGLIVYIVDARLPPINRKTATAVPALLPSIDNTLSAANT